MGAFINVVSKFEHEFVSTKDQVSVKNIKDGLMRDFLKLKSNLNKRNNSEMMVRNGRMFYTQRQRIKGKNNEMYEKAKDFKEFVMMNPKTLPIAWAIHAIKYYGYCCDAKKLCEFYYIDEDDFNYVESWWEKNQISSEDIYEPYNVNLIRYRPLSMEQLYDKYQRKVDSLINAMITHPRYRYLYDLYEDREVFINMLKYRAMVLMFSKQYLDADSMGKMLNTTLKNSFNGMAAEFSNEKYSKHTYSNNKFYLRTFSMTQLIKDENSDNFDILKFSDDPIRNIETKDKMTGKYDKDICDFICDNNKNDEKKLRPFLEYIINNDIKHISIAAKKFGVSLFKLRTPKIKKFLEDKIANTH